MDCARQALANYARAASVSHTKPEASGSSIPPAARTLRVREASLEGAMTENIDTISDELRFRQRFLGETPGIPVRK